MKIILKLTLLLVTIPLSAMAFQSDFSAKEKDFTEYLAKSCQASVKFNLHDYEYGTDETSLYSNRHFADCDQLKSLIGKACLEQPKNIAKVQKIREIFCMRGSLGERKLIQRKNGDLVFLIAYSLQSNSSDYENLLKQDLVKVLNLDFTSAKEIKAQEDKIAKEKDKIKEEAKREEDKKKMDASIADKNKKIQELTVWFQGEVKKITSSPSPDMSEKLNKLSEEYKKKIDEL